MNIKAILLFGFFICIAFSVSSQSYHKLLRVGDASYSDGEYMDAEENYRKSVDKKRTLKGNYNLGNSVYHQERYEEAITHFESAANDAEDDIAKSRSFFNLGNAHIKAMQLEEAIDSYKYAIELNPEDMDARKNLYLAKLMYKQEQQQQQQQQQQSSDENQEQQENQDQEQQQEQQQQEGENEEQENQEQQEGQDENISDEKSSEGAEQPQDLSKEDAQKLLQVIENEEQKVQEKLRKVGGNKKKPKKDW